MNELAQSIITLLVGSAVFIVGMNMMSGGLKKVTGKGLKRLIKSTQNKGVACLGMGAAVTALIQSSAATSVMAIGFVSAGIMTIYQAVCIAMGAYIGTTVTGVLASLSSFPVSKFFVLLAFVGVVLMFFKKELVRNIGEMTWQINENDLIVIFESARAHIINANFFKHFDMLNAGNAILGCQRFSGGIFHFLGY